MSQNRDDLPWFPIYASNMLSDKRYRQMEPIEKGLWISMLLECWTNGSVPADPLALSKWLSWPDDAIKIALTDRVRSFFEEAKGELISPQLGRVNINSHIAYIQVYYGHGNHSSPVRANRTLPTDPAWQCQPEQSERIERHFVRG